MLSVGKGLFGLLMNLHDNAIGTRHGGSQRHGLHNLPNTRSVRWVHHHGQMALLLKNGHSIQVEGVSVCLLVGSNTPFTKNYVLIPPEKTYSAE